MITENKLKLFTTSVLVYSARVSIPERIKKLEDFKVICQERGWQDMITYINKMVMELKGTLNGKKIH